MKVAIVYYSKSGNTKRVAQLLADRLRERDAAVDLIEIEEVKEPGVGSSVKNAGVDLGKYDFILAGSPVWYGKPAPFVGAFMAKAQNVQGKMCALFVTGATRPDRQSRVLKALGNSLEMSGLRLTDCSLALKTKKGEIVAGEENLESFVNGILEK